MLAHDPEAWVLCFVHFISREAMHYTTRPELCFISFDVARKFDRKSLIISLFRFFLRVQVIKISVKFIESMHRGQVNISITKMVLSKLPGAIALIFHQFGQ